MEDYLEKPYNKLTILAPTGFSLKQILKDIESIFKFRDLVPIPMATGEASVKGNTPQRYKNQFLLGKLFSL